MDIRKIIKYATPVVYLRILYSKILEAGEATKYLATAGGRKNAQKLQVDLFIRTHALEKGMFADVKRPKTGGKGLEGVCEKGANYINPFINLMKGER